MDTLLLSASKVFMFLAFWIGIPSALLGMLLVLGFQQKSTAAIITGLLGLGGIGSLRFAPAAPHFARWASWSKLLVW
jgi:hypothetical protein